MILGTVARVSAYVYTRGNSTVRTRRHRHAKARAEKGTAERRLQLGREVVVGALPRERLPDFGGVPRAHDPPSPAIPHGHSPPPTPHQTPVESHSSPKPHTASQRWARSPRRPSEGRGPATSARSAHPDAGHRGGVTRASSHPLGGLMGLTDHAASCDAVPHRAKTPSMPLTDPAPSLARLGLSVEGLGLRGSVSRV